MPGARVVVSADYLFQTCEDQGGSEARPRENVEVRFMQGSRSETLAVLDARGPRASVEVAVDIPEWAHPGPAMLEVGTARPADITISLA